jgi:hypothetical protein
MQGGGGVWGMRRGFAGVPGASCRRAAVHEPGVDPSMDQYSYRTVSPS